MDNSTVTNSEQHLVKQQQAIQNQCFHPQGDFRTFSKDALETSISARFEQQVATFPDRLAIKSDERELTYAQLNTIANHIALSILAGYKDNDTPVVLFIEHGIAMIYCILAVLKVGKIYVPLDPLYPHARNAYVLDDSKSGLMITNNENLINAKELSNEKTPLINIDEIDTNQPADNVNLSISPDQVAYILYTSGSTGQPKGVYQNHRNLLHGVMQYTNTLHICPHDRMTLLYSFNVNGSLLPTFGALLNGASLFPYDLKAKGFSHLAEWLAREAITFYHSVPTVFRFFIDALKGDEQFSSVRLVRFGGERVPTRNLSIFKKHFPPHCILYTGMGSTETSTIRHFFSNRDTKISESVIPTGLAIDEREIILVNDQWEKIETGEIGLIAVRSRYLALGYWQKPEETKKAFRPADTNDDQVRLYLTGDLGRIQSDGCMIHMGRKDAQVKVRGHRVEISEVEATLLKHSSIKEAAVVAWPDAHGDNYLAAYTVPYSGDKTTHSEMCRFLADKLPGYMIPVAFKFLETMPLTPNSKVDRRALPEPEMIRPEMDVEFVAPRTPIEEILADIWSEVLGIDQVGIHDNFFVLGGYSLVATQVLTRVIRTFNLEISQRKFFEAPTIANLADAIISKQLEQLSSQEIEQLLAEVGDSSTETKI